MKNKLKFQLHLLKAVVSFVLLFGIFAFHSKDFSSAFPESPTFKTNLNQNNQPPDIGIAAKTFKAVLVDNENIKWFITDVGIVSFNGEKWILHTENEKISNLVLNGFAFGVNSHGQELWIATPTGSVSVSLPFDASTNVSTFNIENAPILSNNVVQVATGKIPLRWIGTDKGIAAFKSDKWLKPSYDELYPEYLFHDYPITSMATDDDGDTLYVGTAGAGVARVFSNDVDGISGASVYAQWGPILLPSDKIYSIYIASNGTKWFGTDKGIARHIGKNSMEKWKAFTTKDGLVNNFVQAISSDKEGKIWFGTKGGISVFDGSSWNSYTENDGLSSNNVLCLTLDKAGVIWIGTDKGVSSFIDGKFTSYK